MKDHGSSAKKLLDELPFDPEAEAFLDELERSGQFRIGLEAELDEELDEPGDIGNGYTFGRGSGSVSIQDWWTSGRVLLRVNGIAPEDLAFARVNDSLVVRSSDGLDRLTLEGYLGLIPDASTLRVRFGDGHEWTGGEILSRIGSWLSQVATDDSATGH